MCDFQSTVFAQTALLIFFSKVLFGLDGHNRVPIECQSFDQLHSVHVDHFGYEQQAPWACATPHCPSQREHNGADLSPKEA